MLLRGLQTENGKDRWVIAFFNINECTTIEKPILQKTLKKQIKISYLKMMQQIWIESNYLANCRIDEKSNTPNRFFELYDREYRQSTNFQLVYAIYAKKVNDKNNIIPKMPL